MITTIRCFLLAVFVVISVPTTSDAADGKFKSFDEEVARIKKVIKVRCKITPADAMFGALFGCYGGRDETVKIWVNEVPGKKGLVENIKLAWVEYHRRNSFREVAERWLDVLAGLYAPDEAASLKAAFFKRKPEQVLRGRFQNRFTWTVGPSADERILVITEK